MLREVFAGIDIADLDVTITGYGDKELFSALDGLADSLESEAPIDEPAGITYQEQYGVIVMCADEEEQETVYNSLRDMGYTCKVVAT